MDKRFLTILAALVVIFGGIFVISQHSNNKSGGSATPATSHIEGKGQKGVTLVEYGDFQCPVCEAYEPVVEQVRSTYTDQIFFQFRNLPLPSVHPNAFAAARAAEAAGLQNKYFPMHDMLYESANWQRWTTSSSPVNFFGDYAKQLGLNVDQFKADYASDKVNDSINADIREFKKTNQQMGTPTFFLDGEYQANSKLADQNGRPQFEKFKTIIDAEIAKKSH